MQQMDLMQQPGPATPTVAVAFNAEERVRLARRHRRIVGIRPEGSRYPIIFDRAQNGTSDVRAVPRSDFKPAIREAYSIRLDFGVA